MSAPDPATTASNPFLELDRRYLADEQRLLRELARHIDDSDERRAAVRETAEQLVTAMRRAQADDSGIEQFLKEYDLSTEEGVLLMCIAEALLRIPDADTADRLIADKLTAADWRRHLGESESLFVNASTWSLLMTGRLLALDSTTKKNPLHLLGKLVNRVGEPIVRTATRQAMRIMGHQFVMGRTIDEALKRAAKSVEQGYRFSFDMLGEAALTAADAERYLRAYHDGISEIAASDASRAADIFSAPGVSVKLSALHPRLSYAQRERVLHELTPRLVELAEHAKDSGIGLTIDSEEADRLTLTLELFERAYRSASLADYEGFGIAVPTYQRRASDVIGFLAETSRSVGRRVPVRLVKGAYWDAEIKHAQELGLESFPVFTRKSHTDVSYLACAALALEAGEALYLQFATHNAHTLASILQMAGARRDFEFQRLHGMGEELYAEIIDPDKYGRPCRVYAPVGSHEDLLPYLVRRLLENGSNTSFVNRINDASVDVSELVTDPLGIARSHDFEPHPSITPPLEMFGDERANSRGVNLADTGVREPFLDDLREVASRDYEAYGIIDGRKSCGETIESHNPADSEHVIGTCRNASVEDVDRALDTAVRAQEEWDGRPADERAAILNRAADLYEAHTAELVGLVVAEGGRTIPDAISELREAVDFLRYYAAESVKHFGEPKLLPGPTGERNTLTLRGRGVFVCISPWNFPLAIFTGQIAAALAAGNAVLAKPAEATPIVGFRAVQLLHEAGVPAGVLHFLPGPGPEIGGHAVEDARIAGVAFTGSVETARHINRTLASKDGAIPVLIAETGGQNAMFVDSSALPQQVVLDAVTSAFNSAGQRCSALRILCLQEDIADKFEDLLVGYMDQLTIGDPLLLSTDVGPVIEARALETLERHVERMAAEASIRHRAAVPDGLAHGTFCAPTLVDIDSPDVLEGEVFGPVLHVLRYPAKKLAETIDAVNATGFGLTMGLHSRIESRARDVVAAAKAGNIYVNRNMVGAIVGVQPFGGRGLSGTGPKAGGPHYLLRFGTEVTVSSNLAAVGGNASLLSLGND